MSVDRRASRRRSWWGAGALLLILGILAAGIVVVRPGAGSASAAQSAAESAAPESAPSTASASSSPTDVPTPEPSPTPTPTYPADVVDRSWPKNPPWDACPRPVWPGRPAEGSPGDGRRVLVIGDSLTRESRTYMEAALRKSGWTPTFRCWGSKRLDWGLDQLARAKKLDQVPEYVMIAMGTNDISWVDQATTQRRVDTMLNRLGKKRQVLWVDLDIAYSDFSMKRADWFNTMIRQVAKKRDNVTVVPWERIARDAKAARFDGIHYGTRGYRIRGRELAKALDARAQKVDRRASASASATPVSTSAATPAATPSPESTATPTATPTVTPTIMPSPSEPAS